QFAKEIGEDTVTALDRSRDLFPLRRQYQSPIFLVNDQPLLVQFLDHAGDGSLGDIQRGSDVCHAGITLVVDQLVNPFEIIFGALGGGGGVGGHNDNSK